VDDRAVSELPLTSNLQYREARQELPLQNFAEYGNKSMKIRWKAIHVLGAIIGIFLLCPPAFSQANLGRILGAITDESGAAIVGARVTVTDVQRGSSRLLVSGDAGEYSAPNLLPGTYTVRAEYQGFNTVERQSILIEVGTEVRVDMALHIGNQAQTVVVTGEPPAVNTTNSTLGGAISNQTINDVPLNGRNYQNLLTLRPGVTIYPGGGAWTQSTNGIRPEDNTYILDGLTNDNPFNAFSVVNGPAIVGDAVTVIPIDAIQEFATQVNPQAEYGWKPGAIINVQLKSGTNTVHGTAFAFGRSDAFDALNYFSSVRQSLSLEQFGSTAGGSIIKDKLFWFGGYEGQRYSIGTALPVTVPSLAPGGGPSTSVPDAEVDLAAHGIGVSPLSLRLLKLFPTNTNGTVGFPDTNSSDNLLAKVDYLINDHNALSGTFFYAQDALVGQDSAYLQPQWRTSNPQKPITAGGAWTWTPNSNWVNQARIGYTWDNKNSFSLDNKVPASTYGIYTGVTNPLLFGMPQVSISNFSFLGGSTGQPKSQGPAIVWQGIDNVSYLRGKHTFKFGVEVRYNEVSYYGYQGGKGQISFGSGNAFDIPATSTTPEVKSTSLEDFLAGVPRNAKIAIGNSNRYLTSWNYATFFQDDWRVTPKFTLNLGVRYEYVTPLVDSQNLLGNFDPNLGLVQAGKQIHSRYPYNPDHNNFAPRLGLAWDVSGKQTTVIRAGAGIVYDTLAMEEFVNQGGTQNANTLGLANIPTGASIVENGIARPGPGNIANSSVTIAGGPGSTLASNWQSNGPSVPLFQGNTTQCGDGLGSDPGPCSILGIDRNFRTPYVILWNLGVQHAFTNNLSLEVDYVGNHGTKLIGVRDINQGTPIPGSATAAPGPFAGAFPYLGFINFLSNMYRSNYNGLQTTLTVRPTHGLSLLAGYTYSHALDSFSSNFNGLLPQNSMNPALEYASSDYDIRHRLTLTMSYAIPGRKSPGQILQGWAINSIVTLQSAQPWNTNDTVNNISGTNEASDRWDFFGNPSDFTSGPHTIPFCTGPGAGGCTEVISGGGGQQAVQLSAAQSSEFFNACSAAAARTDGGVSNGPTTTSLGSFGCYAQGHSVMIPPALGTFGTMRRNIFRDSGFRNWDLSVTKDWKFGEALTAQFRVEFFNVLNHPNFANPYGGTNTYGAGAFNDPSSTGQFGCGCATPDQAAGDPLLGSGGNRAMQLGLKLIF
jgi:Carboxypeptidase regulatory-like domain/TonB dependent receptor